MRYTYLKINFKTAKACGVQYDLEIKKHIQCVQLGSLTV
jgi:hypothetical protein